MKDETDNEVIQIERRIQQWVRGFVIDLELCPFAKHVIDNESVRYKVSKADDPLVLLSELEAELILLQQNQDIATSLLIAPFLFDEFEDYLDFLDKAQYLLEESQLIGIFQLASFHPHYRFLDTAQDALENFSNRSPYPIIHILREIQVEKAIDAYGDTSSIPMRNISVLQAISRDTLITLTEK